MRFPKEELMHKFITLKEFMLYFFWISYYMVNLIQTTPSGIEQFISIIAIYNIVIIAHKISLLKCTLITWKLNELNDHFQTLNLLEILFYYYSYI